MTSETGVRRMVGTKRVGSELDVHAIEECTKSMSQMMVVTGSCVRLLDLAGIDEWEVTIVSSAEADPAADRISVECPIGEALLGRRPGDLIRVEVPQGMVQFQVLEITHSSQPAVETTWSDSAA